MTWLTHYNLSSYTIASALGYLGEYMRLFQSSVIFGSIFKPVNSVVLVRKRTIPTKRPQPADEVSANFSW
jgi:hypothetical protein